VLGASLRQQSRIRPIFWPLTHPQGTHVLKLHHLAVDRGSGCDLDSLVHEENLIEIAIQLQQRAAVLFQDLCNILTHDVLCPSANSNSVDLYGEFLKMHQ
jgi:hypothetical protein